MTGGRAFGARYWHDETEYFEAAWRNGIASDYESGDCRFDPCGGHLVYFCFSFLVVVKLTPDRVVERAPIQP